MDKIANELSLSHVDLVGTHLLALFHKTVIRIMTGVGGDGLGMQRRNGGAMTMTQSGDLGKA